MAKSIVTRERLGRYTHRVITKNGKETHYLYDNLKGKSGDTLGNGIDGASFRRDVNPFAQLIFADVANMSNKGRRNLVDLEQELFTLDVISDIIKLVNESDPKGQSKEAQTYIETVMEKNPRTAEILPPPIDNPQIDDEESIEEDEEAEDDGFDDPVEEIELNKIADYTLKAVYDLEADNTRYLLIDDKTNTTVGEGVLDNGISTATIADVIFAATNPTVANSVETFYALRPELFTEEVMGDLLRIVHDNMNHADANTEGYISAIKAKNPEVAKIFGEIEQPAPEVEDSNQEDEREEENKENITDNEVLAGYAHRIVEKDGVTIHYLYDTINDKIIGEGIDDQSFPTDVHPIAALLSHDVATMDNAGRRALQNLRPELFNEEICQHLINNAQRLFATVEPTAENTKTYDDYLGLIADRYDLYLKANENEDESESENEQACYNIIYADVGGRENKHWRHGRFGCGQRFSKNSRGQRGIAPIL